MWHAYRVYRAFEIIFMNNYFNKIHFKWVKLCFTSFTLHLIPDVTELIHINCTHNAKEKKQKTSIHSLISDHIHCM